MGLCFVSAIICPYNSWNIPIKGLSILILSLLEILLSPSFSQTFLATYAAVYVVRSPAEIVAAWFLGSFGSVKHRELQPGQHTFAAFQMGSTWLRDLSSEVCDFSRYPWINLVWIPSLSARKKLKFDAERFGERMYQFRLSCVSLIPFRIPLYIIPSNSGDCLGLGESNALCTAIPSFTESIIHKAFWWPQTIAAMAPGMDRLMTKIASRDT